MKLLHVDSSILGDHSVSRAVSGAIVARLQSVKPDLEVTVVDLAASPISHISGAYLAAQGKGASDDPALQEDMTVGETTMAAFLAADIVVIGAPMYNFTIPSQLKAWVDRICVAGKTFRYTEKGPVGLAGGKRVIIAISRGGLYGPETPYAAAEHQETYLRALFGFLGVTDLEVIRAEGLALGPEQRGAAMTAAMTEASALTT